MCLKSVSENPKMALWKSSLWDLNLLSHTCQGRAQILAVTFHLGRHQLSTCAPPAYMLIRGSEHDVVVRRGIKRAAYGVIDDMSWRRAKQWYFIKLISLPECTSVASWPRFSLLLKRDWFNLSFILLHFLISFSDFLILWHSTLNYSLLYT